LSFNNKCEEAIWQALSLCCAEEFVRSIGLDSDFKTLSGGQKQRIAIARAVLR
jgi:ATP-binding cassette, subfamily C, bacterial